MTAQAQAQTYRRAPKKRRKSKIGAIAVPFLITTLISSVILGSIANYYYKKLTADNRKLDAMPCATASISENDINEILFVMTPNEEIRKTAVLLLRFDPIRKTEYCVGIPTNMQIEHNNKKMTVDECAKTYGAAVLRDEVGAALDQKIDRYISMNSDGFQKVVNIFGNAAVIVTVQDYGLTPSDSNVAQNLDSTQLETLITSNKFYSESERSAVIGLAVAALINQSNSKRISSNLDGYFSALINACDTDIIAIDFSNHRHAIEYVFEHAVSPAKTYTVVGSENKDGVFIIDDSFNETLKSVFSQQSSDEYN